MNLTQKLTQLQENGSAIWAANFYNLETLKGILQASAEMDQPLILQLTRGSIEYMGLKPAVAMARAMIEDYDLRAWLHLDHGDSIDLVERCLGAGFDSVMIDASEQPLAENIKICRKVVELAAPFSANVEAELGYVAKLGQSTEKVGFTKPDDAQFFVAETGVNALAVAIGSAHGFYKEEPRLDIALLKKIREAAKIPLVLHGGSGIPSVQVRAAVKAGICKINVATETKKTFMRNVKNEVLVQEEIDLRKIFPVGIGAVKKLIGNKIKILM